MSSESVDSESTPVEPSSDVEELKQLIRRLRPGDHAEYKTGRRNKDTDEIIVRRDSSGTVTKVDRKDGYYRVFIDGPQEGRYVIYPEKPDGKGAYDPPEMFFVSPDPESSEYPETTENSVLSLSITSKREL